MMPGADIRPVATAPGDAVSLALPALHLENLPPLDTSRVRGAMEAELARGLDRLDLDALADAARPLDISLGRAAFASPERLGRELAAIILRRLAP